MGLSRAREQSAAIYFRRGKLLLQPYFQATSGVYIGGEPVASIEPTISDHELGEALVRVLAGSKVGVPHPTDWTQVAPYAQEAASVKTWSAFVKGTLYCSVSLDSKRMSLLPTKNAGARRGFEHLNDLKITLEAPMKPAEIGAAVRQTLLRCQ